jgi:uncharacterized OB-fold protein
MTSLNGLTTTVFLRPDLIVGEASDGGVVPGARLRLAASHCLACSHVEFPALPTCPVCGAEATPVALSSTASLGGYTTVLHPPPGARIPVPYHVGVARFAEGIAVMGLLVEVTGFDLRIGMPVETVAFAAHDDLMTYAFRPVVAAGASV